MLSTTLLNTRRRLCDETSSGRRTHKVGSWWLFGRILATTVVVCGDSGYVHAHPLGRVLTIPVSLWVCRMYVQS